MSDDLVYRLAQQCRREGVTRADIVRKALKQYLEREEQTSESKN
ncbi:ribbon-helix-helix protein, CopG family [Mesorhizobium sp. IMUNJ 23033]